ncbi:DUF3054 domain-containing protein [Streptomonospora wellingtoniae]|uniref:DUF3054 domain-containing protein n=1 Tax=Streptomonospora wellingtoniae TaxID=3075544 RepID=A0ABU2KTB2_9ACTN|nr:DUF3054 domain-containing protein [Streptomonospora sp. DSM 45055]MDT0302333.1 DUF3054 domain-containing protein [Streptomonospora sp. DSM 45055]
MRFVLPAILLDAAFVLVFVVIGRINHAEGLTPVGVAHTLWPFAAALVAGWLAVLPWRPWRNPKAVLTTGWLVLLVTVGGAVQLREATGEDAPFSFVLVTALFLAAALLGWRALAALVRRRAAAPPRTPADTADTARPVDLVAIVKENDFQ